MESVNRSGTQTNRATLSLTGLRFFERGSICAPSDLPLAACARGLPDACLVCHDPEPQVLVGPGPVSRFENYLAPHHGHGDFRLADVLGPRGENIARENCQVSELSRLQSSGAV